MTSEQGYIKLDYPKSISYQRYEDIIPTEQQIQAISSIMKTLANGYTLSFSSCLELKSDGQVLKSLHPFKTLAIIITDDKFKETYRAIFNMYSFNPIRYFFFKQSLKAFSAPVWEVTLLRDEFLLGFASEIKKNPSTLKKLIEEKNWDGFFQELAQ